MMMVLSSRVRRDCVFFKKQDGGEDYQIIIISYFFLFSFEFE
jgi:hypothetical protein